MENLLPTLAIVEKHFKVEKSAYWCAYVSIELAPYYEKLARLDANNPSLVVGTILHDYYGLKSDDDFFVPRLA
jgi:hypothetical protein